MHACMHALGRRGRKRSFYLLLHSQFPSSCSSEAGRRKTDDRRPGAGEAGGNLRPSLPLPTSVPSKFLILLWTAGLHTAHPPFVCHATPPYPMLPCLPPCLPATPCHACVLPMCQLLHAFLLPAMPATLCHALPYPFFPYGLPCVPCLPLPPGIGLRYLPISSACHPAWAFAQRHLPSPAMPASLTWEDRMEIREDGGWDGGLPHHLPGTGTGTDTCNILLLTFAPFISLFSSHIQCWVGGVWSGFGQDGQQLGQEGSPAWLAAAAAAASVSVIYEREREEKEGEGRKLPSLHSMCLPACL